MKNVLVLIGFGLLFVIPDYAGAARVWSSGCEFSVGAAIPNNLEFVIQDSTGYGLKASTTARSGGASCEMVATSTAGAEQVQQTFVTNGGASTATWYFRTYMCVRSMPTTNVSIISFWDKGTDGHEGGIALNTNGTFSYGDDDGTELATSSSAITSGDCSNDANWHWLEVAYNGTDSYEFKFDGNVEFTGGAHDGDGVDSVSVGMCTTNQYGGVCFTVGTAVGDLMFDDMAINDTTGTAQTAYPGAGSIVHMQPDSAGDANGCSAGTFASIDEVTPDDGTTICVLDANTGGDIIDVNVESSANAGIDSYDTVTLVLVGQRDNTLGTGGSTWNARVKSAAGGTTSSGGNTIHNDTTYVTNGDPTAAAGIPGIYTLASYLDPTTGVAWTPTGTNSLDNIQIGANCSDCNPDMNITTLWALVEYVDGSPPVVAPSIAPVHINGTVNVNGLINIRN